MRQVIGLLRVINRADIVTFYNQILSYRTAHAEKLPSLDEFLSLASSGEPKAPAKVFDESTDKFLEDEALRRLAERQASGR